MAKKPDLIVSTGFIIELFNISESGLSRWVKAGCPKFARGLFDVKVVFDWWLVNICNPDNGGNDELRQARAEYWTAKGEAERLKTDQLRGNLFSRDKIVEQWTARVLVVTSGLENFAYRLPPLLVGKSRNQISKIIKQEVRELRIAYATKGHYTPDPEPERFYKKTKPKKKR